MSSRYSQMGWRALTALAFCGAAVGFTVPAIGTSLARQERQQPAVRLLPAPHIPPSETQPEPTGTTPLPTAPARIKPLQPIRAEQRLTQRLRESHVGIASKVKVPQQAQAPTEAAPPKAERPTPSASKEGKSGGTEPKARTEPRETGGTQAPTTTTPSTSTTTHNQSQKR